VIRARGVIAAAVAAAMLAPACAHAAEATFGKTTVGTSSDYFGFERKRVNRYALPEAGTVSKLSVYLAPAGTAGEQVLKGLIYSDASGKPEALLGVSEQLTFKSTNAAGWYQLPFAGGVKLAAGSYWIGVITGATQKVAGFRFDSVSGARDYNANAYSSGPTNPFGAVTTDSEQTSLYATYTPAQGGAEQPTQPKGLSAHATSPSEIELSWIASSDSTGIAGYTIRRNGAVLTSTSGTGTTYLDKGLSASSTYTYTVEAFDSAGHRSAESEAASATTPSASGVQHYEYVFPSNAIDVYDIDNGEKLVKTIALPAAATDVRGVAACPATHTLYVSYGHDSTESGGGFMLAYDLVSEKTLWTRSYSEGVDSMAITPNCKTIYMPVGEASSASNWNVLEAATGNITGSIEGGSGPHNTVVSLNGEHVYMGPRNSGSLTEAETATGKVIKKIGPLLNGGVRPFTINGTETLAFTTATGFLGFQVSSITTGKVLYTVPVEAQEGKEFPYKAGQPGPSSPSHGISLSPDEKELWVMDQPNSYVHVFDISGLPSNPPKQIANIKLTRAMTGSQVGCTYDCLREGWLQHTLDGRYVFVGDSGDVIDTKTRTSVANLEPLYNSRVFIEIDWSGGVPVATSTRQGLGYVTG
jgi:DNA-binding beta-propeller fold protein YncE